MWRHLLTNFFSFLFFFVASIYIHVIYKLPFTFMYFACFMIHTYVKTSKATATTNSINSNNNRKHIITLPSIHPTSRFYAKLHHSQVINEPTKKRMNKRMEKKLRISLSHSLSHHLPPIYSLSLSLSLSLTLHNTPKNVSPPTAALYHAYHPLHPPTTIITHP